jgi:hypothetical protein
VNELLRPVSLFVAYIVMMPWILPRLCPDLNGSLVSDRVSTAVFRGPEAHSMSWKRITTVNFGRKYS